jgi:large subunit ribosomal protein L10
MRGEDLPEVSGLNAPHRTFVPARRTVRRACLESNMDRAQKQETVAALKRTFNETNVVVVTRNLGLSVAQSTSLRNRMREAGAAYKVTKNTLALIALEGTRYAPLSELLTGPTALATSSDPVAAAKAAVDFAKTNDRLEIVGGAMGETMLDVAGVKALAALPSLDELRARIVGLIQAPATKIARTISEPGAQLARVIGAYAAKEAA